MTKELIAKTSTTINAPVSKVWDALIDPKMIKQYMFGTDAVSDWHKGDKIVWKGVWEGKPYEDKGVILAVEPQKLLQFSHYSPLSGAADLPENYHTLTYELAPQGDQTLVSLSQDNNASEDERKHSEQMWESLLAGLKKLLEG